MLSTSIGNNAVSGFGITEVVEGIDLSPRSAVKNGWATASLINKDSAEILDGLAALSQCKRARASIGGMRGFIKQYQIHRTIFRRTRNRLC